jgi:MYXO-CTERM domain-containing protein
MTGKSATMQWALLAALLVGWAMPARAQLAGTGAVLATGGTGATNSGAPGQEDGTINVTMVKAGGEEFAEQQRGSKPINLQACAQGTIEVTISAPGVTAMYPYLEVWYSTGSGMCQQGDRATRVTGSQNCTKLTHNKESGQLSGLSIFNVQVDIPAVCQLNSEKSEGLDGPKTLYFLLLQSQGSTETAQFYKAFTIKVDTHPPEVPAISLAGSGETDIPLKWNLPVTSTGFWIAADYSQGALLGDSDAGPAAADGGAASADCSSNYLKDGERFDPAVKAEGLFTHHITSPTTEFSLDGRLFNGAKRVPIVVIAEDLAGNISNMSKPGCLTVTKTTGFWDRYKQGGGENGGLAEPGCACSVPGARSGRPSTVIAVPVALLLAGVFARRRIRRRAR